LFRAPHLSSSPFVSRNPNPLPTAIFAAVDPEPFWFGFFFFFFLWGFFLLVFFFSFFFWGLGCGGFWVVWFGYFFWGFGGCWGVGVIFFFWWGLGGGGLVFFVPPIEKFLDYSFPSPRRLGLLFGRSLPSSPPSIDFLGPNNRLSRWDRFPHTLSSASVRFTPSQSSPSRQTSSLGISGDFLAPYPDFPPTIVLLISLSPVPVVEVHWSVVFVGRPSSRC